jgi:hypothetical protein
VAASEFIFALPMGLISQISGWGRLEQDFPEKRIHVRNRLRFCTVGLNVMRYRSCVTVDVGEGFVTLRLNFPFRRFHKPITMPISSLQSLEPSHRRFFLQKYAIKDTDVTLWLPKRVIECLR